MTEFWKTYYIYTQVILLIRILDFTPTVCSSESQVHKSYIYNYFTIVLEFSHAVQLLYSFSRAHVFIEMKLKLREQQKSVYP